ncbi:MAG: HAMP domain-containing sensor histidine kinase [Bacillota bacterium]|nr:HAMP domain-containing sensor histidine kinase [Bacillota bacterium]
MSVQIYQPEEVLREETLFWEKGGLDAEELQQKGMLQIAGEHSAYMIHELRSPLQAVSAQLQVLRMLLRRELGDRHEPRFALVFQELEHMQSLMEQFLQLGSLRQSKSELVLLQEICLQCSQILRSLALSKRVELLLEDGPELPPVFGDQRCLRQILTNLLSNAIDACVEAGGSKGQVRISLQEQWCSRGRGQLLCVRDNGCGIQEDCLDRIFEMHFTTKKTGNGLGLALSRSLAVSQGGELWAENNSDGSGASFYLWLPGCSLSE